MIELLQQIISNLEERARHEDENKRELSLLADFLASKMDEARWYEESNREIPCPQCGGMYNKICICGYPEWDLSNVNQTA